MGGSGTPAGRAEELFRNGWASLAGRPTGTSKVTRPIPNASPPYPPSTYFLLDSGSWQVKHRPRHPARNQELTPSSFQFILYLLPVPTSYRVYLLSFSQNNPLPPPLPPPPPPTPTCDLSPAPFALLSPGQMNSLLATLSALSLKSILCCGLHICPLKSQSEKFFH